ncbi:hypothetical protein MH171_000134 [Vibrio parahaemolyticus]|uniref:hypothetical protein n=1 Tax=Vibrio parahaemolyticus TaxID=670 RepID=UPI0028076353|nr:hypothetical protein [Vibrio parahaemolyticus]EIW7860241.1 hypothetical protein [Vibrio parahaemolyticus]ELA7254701.1 hypothetical protein [Vibrio parahaemolyticus]EMF1837918.1 hypothetical protein [Vibrio parahaemolyticus]MEA5184942.1 hypothetical protein [Vibrio parahaemolyticus]HAV1353624.1 hypothetical protein [Vibrio parahaemolyticus]
MLLSYLLGLLGSLVFILGGLASGGLFFYGIYVLLVSSIETGLIFIGSSVVLTITVRVVSAALSGFSVFLGSRVINKETQNSDDPPSVDSQENLKNFEVKMGSNQVQQGTEIADDCFSNGLMSGEVVKLRDIEQYIHRNYEYMPSAVVNGFMKRMQEYVESGVVINLSIEGEGIVFVHRDHSSFLDTPQ